MLVKYEKAKEGTSKKETTNRPNHKKTKKKVRIQNQSRTMPLFKDGNIQTTEQLGKTTIEDSDALKYT